MDVLNYRFKTSLPSPKEMKHGGLKQKRNYFYRDIEHEHCTLKLTTSNLFGQEFVNVELSAPKLLLGSNVEMVTADDLEYLNDTVTAIIYEVVPCIPFEAGESEITRLDLAYNFQTGNETNAHAYRDAMLTKTLPYLTRDICAKKNGVETVYWSNKSQEILIYPKFAETVKLVKSGKVGARFLEKSRGMIRLEHRLLKRDVVGNAVKEFGYVNRADVLVPHLLEMTETILGKDMKKLELDRPIEISGKRERADRLREKCGGNFERFNTLTGFLDLCDTYGESNLVALGMKKGTFRNRKLALKKMGIELTTSDRPHVLQPLTMNPFNKLHICSTASTLPTYITDSPVFVDGVF